MLQNLCGNQRMSHQLLLSLFLLFLGRSFPQLNLNYFGRNCLLGNRNKIAKFLMRFFLPLYFPLWGGVITALPLATTLISS
jgi:hypothetical protein